MRRLDHLLTANAAYAAGFEAGDLSVMPAERLAIVTCMDARLDPLGALGLRVGDAHVIRNAGAVVTDAEIRALAVSQRKLGTRDVLVVQHTDCGMRQVDEAALQRDLAEETGVDPGWGHVPLGELEDDVRAAVERIRASPFLLHTGAVHGLVYAVESGRLRVVA